MLSFPSCKGPRDCRYESDTGNNRVYLTWKHDCHINDEATMTETVPSTSIRTRDQIAQMPPSKSDLHACASRSLVLVEVLSTLSVFHTGSRDDIMGTQRAEMLTPEDC